MSIISRFKEAVSKTVESVKEAFGGGGGGDDDGGGSQYAPSRSIRPIAKPRIGSVKTPSGTVERFATVDIPSRNISAGDRTTDPESSVYSFSGMFGQDDANVMRRIQNADRNALRFPPVASTNENRDRDRSAPATEPATEPAPVAEAPAEPDLTQDELIEEAGETAAEKQRRLGLAQTIATSPSGLLAGGEGTTRRRRSLMGGGLIV